jgi:hypothetical protein
MQLRWYERLGRLLFGDFLAFNQYQGFWDEAWTSDGVRNETERECWRLLDVDCVWNVGL